MISSNEPFRSASSESVIKKSSRALYIVKIIEIVVIAICILLLLLNQYLSVVVDDYSRAYVIPSDDDDDDYPIPNSTIKYSFTTTTQEAPKMFIPERKSTMESLTTRNSTTKHPHIPPLKHPSMKFPHATRRHSKYPLLTHPHSTLSGMKLSPTHVTPSAHKPEKLTENVFKGNPSTNDVTDDDIDNYYVDVHEKRDTVQQIKLNSFAAKTLGMRLKTDGSMNHSAVEIPENHKPKQNPYWIDHFASSLNTGKVSVRVKRNENKDSHSHKHDHKKTNLTNLLVMYPCCVTIMIMLGMELVSHLMKDPMYKSTVLIFVAVCFALGIIIFSTSVIVSIKYENPVMILIAVVSGIFIVLEIIQLILMFTSSSE